MSVWIVTMERPYDRTDIISVHSLYENAVRAADIFANKCIPKVTRIGDYWEDGSVSVEINKYVVD